MTTAYQAPKNMTEDGQYTVVGLSREGLVLLNTGEWCRKAEVDESQIARFETAIDAWTAFGESPPADGEFQVFGDTSGPVCQPQSWVQ